MLVFKVRRLTGMIAVFGMILATSMKANAQERVAANGLRVFMPKLTALQFVTLH